MHRMLFLLCLVLLVPGIAAAQVQSVSPSIIGAGSTPTVTFNGATPGVGHMIAFAPAGECDTTRFAATSLASSVSVTLASAVPAGGTYAVCYSVDGGVSWPEQPGVSMDVVEATPGSVSAVDPSTIGLGTSPPMLFTGAVGTPTTKIAFAVHGQCSSGRVAEGDVTGSGPIVLAPPIANAGSYRVCYSVNGGATWTEQTAPSLSVVDATPGSVTDVDPSTIGAGTSPPMLFTGAVVTPTTKIAFAPAGQCSSGRVAEGDVTGSGPIVLAPPISTAGSYKVCYTVNDGGTWVEQTSPILRVVAAAVPGVASWGVLLLVGGLLMVGWTAAARQSG